MMPPDRERSVADRLEVVRRSVGGDVPAEYLACHVRAAVVQSGPDACLDQLVQWLSKGVEGAHCGSSGVGEGAGDLEGPTGGVVAEERAQHGNVRAIEAVVSRGPLRVGGGEQRRPGGVGFGGGVAVLAGAYDRVPGPPEVVVVLVVPAGDRRVGAAEVLQREQPGAVGGAQVGAGDELAGDLVPADDRCALPPLGEVGLLIGAGGAGGPAESLDLVELGGPLCAGQRRWGRGAEL